MVGSCGDSSRSQIDGFSLRFVGSWGGVSLLVVVGKERLTFVMNFC